MFSVDNFYDFMNSQYGLKGNGEGHNLLCYFQPHGSKNWDDLRSGFVDFEHLKEKRSFYESKNLMIMHDQEPFDPSVLNIYKHKDSLENNEIWRQTRPDSEFLLVNRNLSIGWPIFCHSEYNSADVRFVEQSNVASCHYFWHGLISRDWFRHWKHHGWISPDKSWQKRFLLYARAFTGSRTYRSQLIKDLSLIKNEIHYDWKQNNFLPPDSSATISVHDSQCSAIHIVAETVFDQNKIHLTEKIFKPMVMMQPFILFGATGALQYLRNYGFRTFEGIWDESYDNISDHTQRYQKIIHLIRYLSSLDQKTFNEKLKNIKEIVLHNHQRFFSDQFEQQMLNEIKNNMANCLSWQKEKNKEFPGGSAFFVLNQRFADNIDSVFLKKRCADILVFLKTNDFSRYEAILRQYPNLCRSLI